MLLGLRTSQIRSTSIITTEFLKPKPTHLEVAGRPAQEEICFSTITLRSFRTKKALETPVVICQGSTALASSNGKVCQGFSGSVGEGGHIGLGDKVFDSGCRLLIKNKS